MLSDLYTQDADENDQNHGFLVRDLIRFFIVDIILIIATRLMLGLGVITRPDAHVAVILIGKLVLFFYLIWLVRDRRDAWPATGATSAGKWWGWPASLGLYAVAYPLVIYVDRFNRIAMEKVYAWLGHVYEPAPQDVMLLIFENILDLPVRLLLISFVVLIGPFMEELAFHGMGLDAYKRTVGLFWAVVITSVLFGAYHFSLDLLIPLTFLGLVFGLARVLSHSLWCAVMVHCLHNGLTLAIMANQLGLFGKLIRQGA